METINLTVPRNYSEMTEKQIRYVAALQIFGSSEEDIRTKCFIRFSGIRPLFLHKEKYWFKKKGLKKPFAMSVGEVHAFSKNMDWLTKRYVGISPCAKIGKYAPCDKLFRDITFLQYLDAENYYQAFLFKKEEKYLDKLIGTLYQPGKDYSNSLTEERAKYFARKASDEERLICLMWMIGVKEHFSRKFRFLFKRMDADEDEEPTTAPDMYGIMQAQIRVLTEGDITKREKVLQSLTWDALHELNEKIREAEELKKKKNMKM